MPRGAWLERITIDPDVCFGKPCIKGPRVWVSVILGALARGMKVEEVLKVFPQLVEADIQACIAYDAALARERFAEILLEA